MLDNYSYNIFINIIDEKKKIFENIKKKEKEKKDLFDKAVKDIDNSF